MSILASSSSRSWGFSAISSMVASVSRTRGRVSSAAASLEALRLLRERSRRSSPYPSPPTSASRVRASSACQRRLFCSGPSLDEGADGGADALRLLGAAAGTPCAGDAALEPACGTTVGARPPVDLRPSARGGPGAARCEAAGAAEAVSSKGGAVAAAASGGESGNGSPKTGAEVSKARARFDDGDALPTSSSSSPSPSMSPPFSGPCSSSPSSSSSSPALSSLSSSSRVSPSASPSDNDVSSRCARTAGGRPPVPIRAVCSRPGLPPPVDLRAKTRAAAGGVDAAVDELDCAERLMEG